ncbi:hypothetical protein [Pseudomonas phage 98PfluR60PP]|uniref:Uncharacterized protein n=1 Tax=Pseudomonas phage 98PfluR60PP TaxID=2163965 RepID=A0A2S1PFT8_9CAUD|nr:hypothetical protein PP760_gp07 [Pseudomonas phage 98PfluR60PP]AWH15439.1 hypothetical protein [Pseudomonas phage 98PfluR60PP]
MRQVRKGNVGLPLAVVEAYIKAMDNPTDPASTEAAANMHRAILHGYKQIQEGVEQTTLKVCIGKACHVDPEDMRRFLSKEIPRLTVYANKKTNHNMPLYFAQKPSYYKKNQAAKTKAPAKKKK